MPSASLCVGHVGASLWGALRRTPCGQSLPRLGCARAHGRRRRRGAHGGAKRCIFAGRLVRRRRPVPAVNHRDVDRFVYWARLGAACDARGSNGGKRRRAERGRGRSACMAAAIAPHGSNRRLSGGADTGGSRCMGGQPRRGHPRRNQVAERGGGKRKRRPPARRGSRLADPPATATSVSMARLALSRGGRGGSRVCKSLRDWGARACAPAGQRQSKSIRGPLSYRHLAICFGCSRARLYESILALDTKI